MVTSQYEQKRANEPILYASITIEARTDGGGSEVRPSSLAILVEQEKVVSEGGFAGMIERPHQFEVFPMSPQRLAATELVRLFDTGSLSGLSEWELLVRFVSRRDELAFETLVARHAPMVLGVCRRMLGPSPEVEDAFQATFL